MYSFLSKLSLWVLFSKYQNRFIVFSELTDFVRKSHFRYIELKKFLQKYNNRNIELNNFPKIAFHRAASRRAAAPARRRGSAAPVFLSKNVASCRVARRARRRAQPCSSRSLWLQSRTFGIVLIQDFFQIMRDTLSRPRPELLCPFSHVESNI